MCFVVQVVNDILPVKARKEVDRLSAELQDAQFKLEFMPTTTLEYVESLTFLDEIQERVCLSLVCVQNLNPSLFGGRS